MTFLLRLMLFVLFFNLVYTCPIMCLYVLSSVMWCPLRFPQNKRCSVHLYLQLFVGVLMSYLSYLCLFAYSGVQHILCCVFVLFVFALCFVYPIWPVSLDFPFLISPSVTSNVFLYNNWLETIRNCVFLLLPGKGTVFFLSIVENRSDHISFLVWGISKIFNTE